MKSNAKIIALPPETLLLIAAWLLDTDNVAIQARMNALPPETIILIAAWLLDTDDAEYREWVENQKLKKLKQ
jgi:hypothetical protein